MASHGDRTGNRTGGRGGETAVGDRSSAGPPRGADRQAAMGARAQRAAKRVGRSAKLLDVLRVWGLIGSDESLPLGGDVAAIPA